MTDIFLFFCEAVMIDSTLGEINSDCKQWRLITMRTLNNIIAAVYDIDARCQS